MSMKESNQDQLIAFLESEWEQHQQLERYYEAQLAELTHQPPPPLSPSFSPSPRRLSPTRHKPGRLKTEEASIMEESAISINSHPISKADKKDAKREAPSFEMEYQLLSK